MLTTNLAALLAAHQVVQTQMQPLLNSLKDTTIPLDERWDAFTQLVEKNILVNETTDSTGYLGEAFGHNSVSMYDDFYMERGNTKTFPDIWEAMNEEFFEASESYKSEEARTTWRERVLASGFSGFTYDW